MGRQKELFSRYERIDKRIRVSYVPQGNEEGAGSRANDVVSQYAVGETKERRKQMKHRILQEATKLNV